MTLSERSFTKSRFQTDPQSDADSSDLICVFHESCDITDLIFIRGSKYIRDSSRKQKSGFYRLKIESRSLKTSVRMFAGTEFEHSELLLTVCGYGRALSV